MLVTAGALYCSIDDNGCVTDGVGLYGDNEACTVLVNQAGTLNATEFATESTHDRVTIAERQYSGTVGPSNVAVAAGSTFTWRSDHSVTYSGWTICYANNPTSNPTSGRMLPVTPYSLKSMHP